MDHPHLFESLKNDSEKCLYVGCSKFTKFSATLRLYNLKEGNSWAIRVYSLTQSLERYVFWG